VTHAGDPGVVASVYSLTIIHTPGWGEGGRGYDRVGVGEEGAPTSLAPLPSVLGGEREGGGSP
jgi:hypothetical protein